MSSLAQPSSGRATRRLRRWLVLGALCCACAPAPSAGGPIVDFPVDPGAGGQPADAGRAPTEDDGAGDGDTGDGDEAPNHEQPADGGAGDEADGGLDDASVEDASSYDGSLFNGSLSDAGEDAGA